MVPILQPLLAGRAVVSQRENVNPNVIGRPPRIYYRPADTELGTAFAASLEVPPICGLEIHPNDTNTSREAEPSRASLAAEIISISSRKELEQIIAQAQRRIEQLDNQL